MTLGQSGDTQTVERLIRALDDQHWEVRRDAAEALGKVSHARAVWPLVQALHDEYWEVRRSAAEALGKIGDEAAVEPLIQALLDEHWEVRGSAVLALRKIGDARAIRPLVQALFDEHWEIRLRAAETLWEMGGAETAGLFLKALQDEIYRDQRAAWQSRITLFEYFLSEYLPSLMISGILASGPIVLQIPNLLSPIPNLLSEYFQTIAWPTPIRLTIPFQMAALSVSGTQVAQFEYLARTRLAKADIVLLKSAMLVTDFRFRERQFTLSQERLNSAQVRVWEPLAEGYAIAQIDEYAREASLYLGREFTLKAGIGTSIPPYFIGHAIQFPASEAILVFDIAVHAESMQIRPHWIQPFVFHPGREAESEMVEFRLTPEEQGHKDIRVEFYYQRHWLTRIEFEFEVVGAGVPVLA